MMMWRLLKYPIIFLYFIFISITVLVDVFLTFFAVELLGLMELNPRMRRVYECEGFIGIIHRIPVTIIRGVWVYTALHHLDFKYPLLKAYRGYRIMMPIAVVIHNFKTIAEAKMTRRMLIAIYKMMKGEAVSRGDFEAVISALKYVEE
jgi:hypothetical protein